MICEQIGDENIPELNNFKLNEFYSAEEFYHQYELFKKPESIAILLNTSPSILASLAPPLWMIQNRLWTLFSITMLFYIFLFYYISMVIFYRLDLKVLVCGILSN